MSSKGVAGKLIVQKYNNFRGVDFTDTKVNQYRSPDALNMWKNYKTLGKCIETRPGIELQLELSNTIYGLFFYTIDQVDHWIIHCGTSLYDYNPVSKVNTQIKASGMNPRKSTGFVFNNIFFILDGLNYLEYNGETLKDVVGTIPETFIGCKPSGGGTPKQNVNLISDFRKEKFWADGTSTEYHLNSKNISNVSVWIDGTLKTLTTDYTVDGVNGIITFTTTPAEAESSDNVVIQYKKVTSGYANRLKKCTIAAMFDNRIFFAGNQDYPNTLLWSELKDPRYISDINNVGEGTDIAKVKALVPGNNALWVFKESSQANTTVFYHTPAEATDDNGTMAKIYPSIHSSISIGCNATGINFNDDIVFFSNRGMEGISGDITTEQVLGHRSTLVDRKLLNETNYKDMCLVEHEGYLLTIIDDHIYLADSRQKISNNDHMEYEWFYWELDKKIENSIEHNGILYLCSQEKDDKSGIYTLTNNNTNRDISSYWETPEDDYNYPQMLKTTNKKGFKSDIIGTPITISVKTDNNTFESLGDFTNTKGYIVTKIKEKKWNKIQLKYSASKPFGIYAVTLESFIGSYVKR